MIRDGGCVTVVVGELRGRWASAHLRLRGAVGSPIHGATSSHNHVSSSLASPCKPAMGCIMASSRDGLAGTRVPLETSSRTQPSCTHGTQVPLGASPTGMGGERNITRAGPALMVLLMTRNCVGPTDQKPCDLPFFEERFVAGV